MHEPTDELLDRVLRGDATQEEREAIDAWRHAAPQNERRYRQVERIAGAARALQRDLNANALPTVAALLQRSWRTGAVAPRNNPSSRWWKGAAAAAAVFLAAAGGLYLGARRASTLSPAEIVTGSSELATIQLRDGSVVRLAPKSRLRLGTRADGRDVTLDGRAFFAVAKASGRPFFVHTRFAVARVLGTHFELATREDDLELVVVEGHVALDAPANTVQVRGGESSRVARGTATQPVHVENAQGTLKWIGKFLVFQSTPLHEVARELARTYGVHVAITDSVLARQTVTATFTDRSAEQVLDVVCSVVNAQCAAAGSAITMSRR